MTSIWFPNNKYRPNTKNYLPCFVLGGGFSIRRKGLFRIRAASLSKPYIPYMSIINIDIINKRYTPCIKVSDIVSPQIPMLEMLETLNCRGACGREADQIGR